MKYEILDSRDRIGNKTEDNGLVFNDVENNKAFFEHSTAFNTGNVAGTMGFEVNVIDPAYKNNDNAEEFLFLQVPASDADAYAFGEEVAKNKGELVSVVAGNNYDCVGYVENAYQSVSGDEFFYIFVMTNSIFRKNFSTPAMVNDYGYAH